MNLRLLLCVVCVPLLAAAREPKPRTYDIIIVGDGKTEDDAQAALDPLKAKGTWPARGDGFSITAHVGAYGVPSCFPRANSRPNRFPRWCIGSNETFWMRQPS